MNKQQILIEKPFNEQYILLIETEAKLINAFMKSKTQAKYDFSVLRIYDNFIECRLLQLELNVIEANNDLIKEIAQVTAAFNKMFNELHLKLNNQGEIIEILNLELILYKWQQVKSEMESAMNGNQDIRNLISTNDNLFANPQKIKDAIKGNEFLQTYFSQIFGVKLPLLKTITGTNIFNTAVIDWSCSINAPVKLSVESVSDIIKISTKSEPKYSLTSKFNKQAYSQFADKLDISKLSSVINESSQHIIENDSGKLIQCLIKKTENVHPDLYMKINYRIINEEIFLKNIGNVSD